MKKKDFLYACLVPIIVFLFYLPSLLNGFVNWDDPDVFWQNPMVKDFSWQGIQSIFGTMWAGGYHRFLPLSMTAFATEYHFFGLNPVGYHLMSVLMHSLNSLLVFVLIYFLTARANVAIAGSLLFGLHPLSVQPVVWASAASYPFGTFFFLGAVVLYVWHFLFYPDSGGFDILTFIAFLLALLFYSQLSMPLPFILLAIDYYLRGRIGWSDVLLKLPFFLLAFYFGLLTLNAAHHVGPDYAPFFLKAHLSFFQRLDLSCVALWMYVQKFLIPYPLACWYPTNYYSHGLLSLYAFLVVGVFSFFFCFRRQEGLQTSFFGLLWFLVTMAPFLHLYGVNESMVNDRYFYIPSIGILLMLTGVWENLQKRKIVTRVPVIIFLKCAGCLWFVFIILLSHQQIKVWKDSRTLWTDFITEYPAFPDGYLSRSEYYLKMKQPLLALKDIDMFLKLAPHNAAGYQNRGRAFFQLRQWRAEIEAYNKLLELKPNSPQVLVDRGAAHFMLGENALAIADFKHALRLDPHEVNALNNLIYLKHVQSTKKVGTSR